MNTRDKKYKAIEDMRGVARNPLRAIRLLRSLKRGEKPTEEFAGFLKYYLGFIRRDITPITTIDIFKSRSARCDLLLMKIRELWLQGFIDDVQYHLLLSSVRLINKLIKRYFLIYITL